MKLTGDALATLIDVRIPHHGRPATFPLSDYAQASGLLVAMVFAWRIWRSREEYDPRSARPVGFLVAVTLGVLVMGYTFRT